MDRDFPDRLSDDDIKILNMLASLPDPDPLGFLKNMRANLVRALSYAENMQVTLYDGEIKHWINGIGDFLLAQSKDEDSR